MTLSAGAFAPSFNAFLQTPQSQSISELTNTFASLEFLKIDGSNFMQADLDVGNHYINSVLDPVFPSQAATKNYVDNSSGGGGGPFLKLDGTTPMTGAINMSNNTINNLAYPISNAQATNKQYVDDTVNLLPNIFLALNGSNSMLSDLDVGSNNVINVLDPVDLTDGANKRYVDFNFLEVNGSNMMIGDLNMNNNHITNVGFPLTGDQAINRSYLESNALLITGTNSMLNNLNVGSHYVTNVLSPVSSDEATNKAYVDAISSTLQTQISAVTSSITQASIAFTQPVGTITVGVAPTLIPYVYSSYPTPNPSNPAIINGTPASGQFIVFQPGYYVFNGSIEVTNATTSIITVNGSGRVNGTVVYIGPDITVNARLSAAVPYRLELPFAIQYNITAANITAGGGNAVITQYLSGTVAGLTLSALNGTFAKSAATISSTSTYWTIGGDALSAPSNIGSTTNQNINIIRNNTNHLTLTSLGTNLNRPLCMYADLGVTGAGIQLKQQGNLSNTSANSKQGITFYDFASTNNFYQGYDSTNSMGFFYNTGSTYQKLFGMNNSLLNASSLPLSNLIDPIFAQDAVTKNYVDNLLTCTFKALLTTGQTIATWSNITATSNWINFFQRSPFNSNAIIAKPTSPFISSPVKFIISSNNSVGGGIALYNGSFFQPYVLTYAGSGGAVTIYNTAMEVIDMNTDFEIIFTLNAAAPSNTYVIVSFTIEQPYTSV